jgi:hypothetical protein
VTRFLIFALFAFAVWTFLRAVLRRSNAGGSLEPEFRRFEDLVEIPAPPEAIAAARRKLDAAGIPTTVRESAILVPRGRLEEARAIVAKRVN